MSVEGEEKTIKTNRLVIPYKQRNHFKKFHASLKRWRFVVAHRRAGKSVAEINELIKRALQNDRVYPPPRYAYIGPTFAQTKDLIWGYLKHYTSVLMSEGCTYSESELSCTLPNGAMINLYGGASAYERMRGLYFDGAVADEYPLLNPSMFSTVIRPCLADYRGFFIASGTSNGDDHFHALKVKADKDDDWDVFIIPVTETDALHPDELLEMSKDMSPDEYAREMLCSFAAPVEGAYYGDIMNDLEAQGRICGVPWDPATTVWTEWDLGIDDEMEIIFKQEVGREIHVIDHVAESGHGLEWAANQINLRKGYGWVFKGHILPHDVKARELGTGKSRFEILSGLVAEPIVVAPSLSVEDGIAALRSVLPMMWFDKEKTAKHRLSLRNYHRGKNGKPVHNWASHGADAARIGAVGMFMLGGLSGSSNVIPLTGPLKRRLRGSR